MDEHPKDEVKEPERHAAPEVRKHPKPAMATPASLNQAVRQELWYVDTMVASPFRMARRQLKPREGAMAESADEALWAMEGMARLPIKLLQAAFGEGLKPPSQNADQKAPESPDNGNTKQ